MSRMLLPKMKENASTVAEKEVHCSKTSSSLRSVSWQASKSVIEQFPGQRYDHSLTRYGICMTAPG